MGCVVLWVLSCSRQISLEGTMTKFFLWSTLATKHSATKACILRFGAEKLASMYVLFLGRTLVVADGFQKKGILAFVSMGLRSRRDTTCLPSGEKKHPLLPQRGPKLSLQLLHQHSAHLITHDALRHFARRTSMDYVLRGPNTTPHHTTPHHTTPHHTTPHHTTPHHTTPHHTTPHHTTPHHTTPHHTTHQAPTCLFWSYYGGIVFLA